LGSATVVVAVLPLSKPCGPSQSAPELLRLRRAYEKHFEAIGEEHSRDAAARLAVGGDFHAIGTLEYYVLKAHGLTPDQLVVDVGCGTGRLACQLARRGHRRYAGFDITESAVDYARSLCGENNDWKFETTDGLHIALPDAAADVVCFFSVFTHLTHEHTFLYLREAARLLREGGLIILSFLEFGIDTHWTQFEAAVRGFGKGGEPIVLLDRGAIRRFAGALGLEVLGLVDGNVPTFPIEEEIVSADGRVMTGRGYLGQSLGILRKHS
jgi:SAM-dependent methyltransferase